MQILNQFNAIYEKLYVSILNQGYPLLDTIDGLFYDIIKNNRISKMNTELINLFSKISFSIVIFIVTLSVFKYFILSIENKEKENLLYILIKIAIVYIISNNSKFIIDYIINIFSIFNDLILEFGHDVLNKDISFKSLVDILTMFKVSNNDLFSIEGIINMAICYGTINFIISMSVKYVVFNLFIVISPIMLLFFYSGSTQKIASIWLRNIIYFMFSQVLIKIILVFPIMYGENDIILRIIVLGVLYLFYRIDMYIKELVI